MLRIKILILLLFPLSLSAIEVIRDFSFGRVFIVDDKFNIYSGEEDRTITKYSERGAKILEIGKPGEGPGDIKRLAGAAINPIDHFLYVCEFPGGNRRVSKFSMEDGKFQGTWESEFDWKKWQGIRNINFDSSGNIYIMADKNLYREYKGIYIGGIETKIFKYSFQGKKLKEIYFTKKDYFTGKEGKGEINIPFTDNLNFLLNDDRIIIMKSHDDFIQVFNLDGVLLKKISLPFKREKLLKADIERWQELVVSMPHYKRGIQEGWFDLKFWIKNMPFPEYKPVTGGLLLFNKKGTLYTNKYRFSINGENIIARINTATGDFNLISFPGVYDLLYIKENFFFFSKIDADDNTYLIKVNDKELYSLK